MEQVDVEFYKIQIASKIPEVAKVGKQVPRNT